MGMFRTYLKDNNGQFAIMFSLFATVLVIGAIVAVDIARLVNTKTKIAAVTDAAALAGAQAFDQVNRISIVEDFLNSNGGQILPAAIYKCCRLPQQYRSFDHCICSRRVRIYGRADQGRAD